jgi:hypothetical protein
MDNNNLIGKGTFISEIVCSFEGHVIYDFKNIRRGSIFIKNKEGLIPFEYRDLLGGIISFIGTEKSHFVIQTGNEIPCVQINNINLNNVIYLFVEDMGDRKAFIYDYSDIQYSIIKERTYEWNNIDWNKVKKKLEDEE